MSKKNQQEEILNIGEAVSKSEAFINKYKKLIVLAIVVVIAAIAGYISYNKFYAEPREKAAQIEIAKGQQYFELGEYEVALKGDSLGYKGFSNVIEKYSGTKTSNLARAYAGLCYAKLGEYENAIKMLDSFSADDAMVSPAVLGAKGNSYANLGQMDKAANTLLQAAEKADNVTLSPIFLMQAADILKTQGKLDDALKAYKKVKEKYFNSLQAMDIDKYIEQVELMKQ